MAPVVRAPGAVTASAFAIGIVCIAQGTWIHAKAALAQVLIAAAWRREQSGVAGAHPWPWADTRPLAKLVLGDGGRWRELIVLEGASGRNLAFGPAHDPASVVPGARGNSVIEGHRDTHFAFLRTIRIGARLQSVLPDGSTHRFVVTDLRVVDSRRARIALDADRPRLTLVTCYPFDAIVPGGPLRYVATAESVD